MRIVCEPRTQTRASACLSHEASAPAQSSQAHREARVHASWGTHRPIVTPGVCNQQGFGTYSATGCLSRPCRVMNGLAGDATHPLRIGALSSERSASLSPLAGAGTDIEVPGHRVRACARVHKHGPRFGARCRQLMACVINAMSMHHVTMVQVILIRSMRFFIGWLAS